MTTRAKFKERREKRRADAANRQAARDRRGDAGQLDKLDLEGERAVRERTRLNERLIDATVEATRRVHAVAVEEILRGVK